MIHSFYFSFYNHAVWSIIITYMFSITKSGYVIYLEYEALE